MTENEILKKIAIARAKPNTLTDLKPRELVDLVLVVLDYAKNIHLAIEDGRIKGDKGDTPVPDVDYLSVYSSKQYLEDLFKQALNDIQQDVQSSLSNLKDGKDGLNGKDGKDAEITQEHLEKAAQMALALVELPDFQSLITQEPEAIRNSLELLEGDERLDVSAIKGLEELLSGIKTHPQKDMAVGGIRFMSNLADVVVSDIQNGEALIWNSTNGRFENGSIGGISEELAIAYAIAL